MSSFITYDFFSLYGELLNPFRNKAFGPELATLLLLLALLVLLGFLCFAVPQGIRLRVALHAIRGTENSDSDAQKRASFASNFDNIDRSLSSNSAVSPIWQEFRKGLIIRNSPQRTIILNPVPPSSFFNLRNLHVQYDFVRSLPNFFVGLGLLGTFIGLIAALTFSTQSLTDATNQEQIKEALKGLLTTAAAKFYISAAGLVSSLILAFLIRLVLKRLHRFVHQINAALEERLIFLSPQTISETQLTVQRDSLEELKLFNTNIAMKIGDAVRTAVETSNETVTRRLEEVASSFTSMLETTRDGAGNAVNDAMKGAFNATLHQAGEAIGSVASSLQDLPARLAAAANAIQEAGNIAARQQEKLADTVQTAVEKMLSEASGKVAANIEKGTQSVLTDLGETGAVFGESAAKISAFLARFETGGTDFLSSLSGLADQNANLESKLSGISSQIVEASNGIGAASKTVNANLEIILGGIRDFTKTASDTSRGVHDSQETIRKTVDTLQQQMSQHIQRYNVVDEKLATVFNSISSHIELQSKQMSEQFSRMDSALASAVNQFENLIDDLTEATAMRSAAE